MKIFYILFLLLVSGCSFSSSKSLNINPPSDNIVIYKCLYQSMNETLITKKWSWWEAKNNNCLTNEPNRGSIILKQIEFPKNKLCAQFFEYYQNYNLKKQKWNNSILKITIACLDKNRNWQFVQNSKILDNMVIDEILN